MTGRQRDADGFGAFFRRYTRTWIHAVATAALTGFGTLTFLHPYFAALAVAAYVLPPVVLYLGSSADPVAGDGERSSQSNQSDRSDGQSTDPHEQRARPGPTTERDAPSKSSDGSKPIWKTATVPTDETLHDVVVADGRTYAVSAAGGVFVGDAESWQAVLDDGPGARSSALRSVDAASDGGVWFAGDGGALGRIDPSTDRHVDCSAPNGDTTAITDVAVARTPDGETVLLTDGSGRVRRGRYHDGDLAWDEPTTPGSGSSVTGVVLVDGSTGYVCDSNQGVFATSDGGRSFDRIGLDAADGTLSDVAAIGDGQCAVCSDDGVWHRYDGARWTPRRLGDDALWSLAVHDEHWLACGDGGVVYERGDVARGSDPQLDGGLQGERRERNDPAARLGDWHRLVTPATVPLQGCSIGPSIAVAVGEAGTLVERPVE